MNEELVQGIENSIFNQLSYLEHELITTAETIFSCLKIKPTVA